MKNTTIVDSRACGSGKTVDGMYSIISECQKNQIPFVVSVPSIDLQKQYKTDHNSLSVINCNLTNSSENKTTTAQITDAMVRQTKEFAVTRQAHILAHNLPNKEKYIWLNDEGLDNLIRSLTLETNEADSPVRFDWMGHFEVAEEDKEKMALWLTEEKLSKYKFARLIMTKSCSNRALKSESYQLLANKNYDFYISPYDYKIIQEDGERQLFNLIGIIKPSVATGYMKQYVSSAAFEKTMFRWWMDYHQLPYDISSGCEFKPHKGNVIIEYVDDNWSKLKQKDQKGMMNSTLYQFHRYVDSQVGSNPVIVLRNARSSDNFRYQNEIEVKHNVHGMNNPRLIECRHIVIESAINPSPQLEKFFKNILLDGVTDNKDEIIAHMFSCHLFYQIVLRSYLRSKFYNGENIHIYMLDKNMAQYSTYYYESPQLKVIPVSQPINKKIDPVVEITKLRIKLGKKQNDLEDLLLAVGDRTMTNSERVKKSRLISDIDVFNKKISELSE